MKISIVSLVAALLAVPAMASADEANLSSARTAVAEMDQAEAVVSALLQSAQANNDAIKVSCLGDKATQIRGYAAGARKALTRASFVGAAEADATYKGIATDGETVRRLREEANACVGVDEVAAAEEAAKNPGQQKVDAMALDTVTEGSRMNAGVPVRSPAPASPTN